MGDDGKTFNPSRLTLARKRRGLSKTALAQSIGVDLRSVSGYESGEYPPADQTLDALERVLTFPRSFFSGDDLDEPTPDVASFRAMSKMTASQRDMALGEGALALLLNDWLEKRFELPKSDLPDLGRETDPEAAAASLRRYWGLGELPVKNVIHLLEAKGVRVFSLSIDAREVDAFSMWKESTPFVFLNTQKSAEHGRFDAAHELGHLVLHRHAAPQGREAEREADAFASAFLMPRASVFARAPRFATIADLIKLKKIWTVSVAALNYRLHDIGVLSDWHYRSLCIEISQRGFRTTEPDEAPRESSQVLPKIFGLLREDGISRTSLAEGLSLNPHEIDQLVFGLAVTSIDGGRIGQPASPAKSRSTLALVK